VSDNYFVALQHDNAVEKDIPGLSTEALPVSSREANQLMIMKVDEVSDMQEEAVPVPIPWLMIKAECEVSRMSLSC
jgi:hypothetical protein